MAEKVTYQQRITPAKRVTLADYFRVSNQHYPGYIRQDIFKSKMKKVFDIAQAEFSVTQISALPIEQDPVTRTLVSPYEYLVPAQNGRKDFRSFIITLIDTMEWRPASSMRNMSSELRKYKNQHLKAAAAEPVFQIVGGKAVEKGAKIIAKGTAKVVKSGKVNAKVGTVLTKLTTTYEYKPKNFKKEIVHFNATELAESSVIDKFKPKGFSSSLSNDMTVGGLQKITGLPEWLAALIMDGIDLASDFFPVVSITKGVEDCLANLSLSYMYWDQEKAARKVEEHFNTIWKELTAKLKTFLKKDICSLNDNELKSLHKLLTNNN